MNQTLRRSLMALALTALLTAVTAPAFAQLGRQQGLIEPNTATEQQLLTVPNLNATIVKALIERRPFLTMKELDTFLTSQSLTRAQLAQVYAKMFLHINLNTATAEEIQMIPGAGTRMAHEFEEYRPWRSFDQFRREIGKYVNATEVARLEQYVFVPVNLNTASDADISSIPGLGARMLREFKEYRPYANIEQFRREMGKYVNAKEVARLERYITL